MTLEQIAAFLLWLVCVVALIDLARRAYLYVTGQVDDILGDD